MDTRSPLFCWTLALLLPFITTPMVWEHLFWLLDDAAAINTRLVYIDERWVQALQIILFVYVGCIPGIFVMARVRDLSVPRFLGGRISLHLVLLLIVYLPMSVLYGFWAYIYLEFYH